MTSWWGCVLALLFVVLHLHSAATAAYPVLRREDVAPTVTVAPTTPATGNEGKENEVSTETTAGPKSTQSPTAAMTTFATVTTTTAFPSAINGNNPGNNSSLEISSVVLDGELPLHPRLTPGWGIAGALLLITGATYTLVGIKNVWLHTFFSAAFLSGLSVTVLIVYVMVVPVSDAVEGAYVVAAVVAGVILGGAATIFREITEGLGCLLGGFCLAMWLLTLKAGGLLPSTPAKAIFIAAFSAISFSLYFSRHTRPYAQMGLMSFAGATVTVIGIDCFSRAGLKEFWAYIWNLNAGLFPANLDTYPLTKGIRVEIALAVVFTILGIISQLKLWRVIQQRRAKKAEEQAKEQQMRDEEEAALGLQIEEQNAKERQQWESVYGNHPPRSSIGSKDSGLGGVEDEKEPRLNQVATRRTSSNGDDIEMADLTTPDVSASKSAAQSTVGLMKVNHNDDTGVTVRVAKDDYPAGSEDSCSISEPNEKVRIAGDNGESRRGSAVPSKTPGPSITPLPFKIPDELDADDSHSSIAAYADEDDANDEAGVPRRKLSILTTDSRLSISSGKRLRSVSQQSARSTTSKQNVNGFDAQRLSVWDANTEKPARNPRHSTDVLSVIATIDGLSQNGDDYDYITKGKAIRQSLPVLTVNINGDSSETHSIIDNTIDDDMNLKPQNRNWGPNVRHISLAETVGTDILNPYIVNSSSGELSKQSTQSQDTKNSGSTNENGNPTEPTDPTEITAIEDTSESSNSPKSLAPSTTSISVSLTKDRLPSALPRVALSYRTNEWAKHLSLAEAPPLENLLPEEPPNKQNQRNTEVEVAAPVHVEELQQTAESGVPPTSNGQPSPSTSNLPQVPSAAYRSSSRIASGTFPLKTQGPWSPTLPVGESPDTGALTSPTKPISPNPLQASHSLRNKGPRRSSEFYTQPIQEENDNDNELAPTGQPALDGSGGPNTHSIPPPASLAPGAVSYSSPLTLLGKREMLLRHKSQSQLFNITPIQEHSQHVTRPASQMALSYGYAMASPLMPEDADDIPLSQRKQLMHQSNMISAHPLEGHSLPNGAMSPTQRSVSSPTALAQPITAESSNFDSHQPDRRSTIPSQAERDARLSHFRQSVAAGLRGGTPVVGLGRETPLILSASSPSLLRNTDVDRSIEQQRALLITQREQEAQKRESERWGKERNERAFEEMMRRGDLMDAHREALRRMQGEVKQA
ncbi:hypothetical protein F4861DRAFT_176316 [Xylaria intraflava]|nr:hypothetical protein F4861DRAFT_176316 [Xylaria intraflava]